MEKIFCTHKYWKIIQLCAISFAVFFAIFAINELSTVTVFYFIGHKSSIIWSIAAITPATVVVLLGWFAVSRKKKQNKCEISAIYGVYGLSFAILVVVAMLSVFSIFVIVTEIYIMDYIHSWLASEKLKKETRLGVYPLIPLVMHICLTWFFCVRDADLMRRNSED